MNYYPHHIGDYLTATRHLSWDEDCAFRRMRDKYFATEKPLPLELKDVWRQVLATTEVQREAVKTVLEEFFQKTDAGWINADFDTEIMVMRGKQQKQRDKANKRWQKPTPESGNAPAMPRHAEGDAAATVGDAVAMPPTPTPTPIEESGAKAPSSAAKLPPAPVQEIIDLYHEVLPDLPAVRLKTKDRERAIGKTWRWALTSKRTDGTRRAQNASEALSWFREYFSRARDNDFLMGRTHRGAEHANWRCDLDFLLTDKGMKHVIEKTLEAA